MQIIANSFKLSKNCTLNGAHKAYKRVKYYTTEATTIKTSIQFGSRIPKEIWDKMSYAEKQAHKIKTGKLPAHSESRIPKEIWDKMSYAEKQTHKIKTGRLSSDQISTQHKRQVTQTVVKTPHPGQPNIAARQLDAKVIQTTQSVQLTLPAMRNKTVPVIQPKFKQKTQKINSFIQASTHSESWVPREIWDKMSPAEKQAYKIKTGKLPARSDVWVPREIWDKMSPAEKQAHIVQKINSFIQASTQPQKPITAKASRTWITPSVWKVLSSAEKQLHVRKTGKLPARSDAWVPREIWDKMSPAEKQAHRVQKINSFIQVSTQPKKLITPVIPLVWIIPSLWVRMNVWAKVRYFHRQEWYFKFLFGIARPYWSLLAEKQVTWSARAADDSIAKRWVEPRMWSNMSYKAGQTAKAPILARYHRIVLLALVGRLVRLMWNSMPFEEKLARLLFTTRSNLVGHCLRLIVEFFCNLSLKGSLLSAKEWARMTDWQKKRYLTTEVNLERRLRSVKATNKKLKSGTLLKNHENKRRK